MNNSKFEKLGFFDTRDYKYSLQSRRVRPEYGAILDLVPYESKVVDLGCGDGSLGELLIAQKKTQYFGFEISQSGVESAVAKGLSVIQGSLDNKLPYADQQFDFAICNVTLQMLMFPDLAFKEMLRVSQRQIVSFPNFGFYKNRIELLLRGKMPTPLLYGYKWYNTGHIHQFSYYDYLDLCRENHLKVESVSFLNKKNLLKKLFIQVLPNLFADVVIVKTVKDS